MVKNLTNRLHDSKGFSLVELIVVIAIMVILIALLVPNVVGYISKAQDSANLSAAKSIYNAANTCVIDYKAQHGGYPGASDLADLLYNDDNPTESLATVPKGTAVAIGYDTGNVWAVVVGSTSNETSTVDGDNVKNIQAYAPTASGNVYVESAEDAADGQQYITHDNVKEIVKCISITGEGKNKWTGGDDLAIDTGAPNLVPTKSE
jgi:type IV pilus assembly protein PilA